MPTFEKLCKGFSRLGIRRALFVQSVTDVWRVDVYVPKRKVIVATEFLAHFVPAFYRVYVHPLKFSWKVLFSFKKRYEWRTG